MKAYSLLSQILINQVLN